MKNKISCGEVFDVTIASTVAPGDVVVMQDRIGVAVAGGVSGDTIAVDTEGAFELKKRVGDTIAQGQSLYWDEVNNELTIDDSPNNSPGRVCFAGFAYRSALSAATTAVVVLTR
jgi:predicted RecA/RadA family phage recombinase